MEDRRSRADQHGADQQHRIAAGVRQHDEADECRAHADDQRVGLRPAVGIEADDGLQQRGGELEGQRDEADLAEVEAVGVLDQRIDRRQQRLHHVVEQMREAERQDDGEGRFRCRVEARRRIGWQGLLHGFPENSCASAACRLRPDTNSCVREVLYTEGRLRAMASTSHSSRTRRRFAERR
jgi:hypothetical protein